MLRVIGAAPATACSLAIDEYVPLRWRCGDVPVPLHWRTGDFDVSLLDIGLDPASGTLCAVTLTSTDGYVAQADDAVERHWARGDCRNGLPVCDISEWPGLGQGHSDYDGRYRD